MLTTLGGSFLNHSEAVSFIWGTADLLRDSFKRGKYQDVILPLTVLRRIDSVLTPTKEAVLEANNKYGRALDNPDQLLRKASGHAFYNTSRYDFERLVADPPNLAANLRNYIAGFSPNMREVIEKFDFDNTINKLVEADLLFLVVERFKNVDLSPISIDNHAMGTVFEELIRKFNEALNENPGEHFTPRDVVSLMVDLMLAGDTDALTTTGKTVTVYDPCCGSGGLLTITKGHIHAKVSPDVGVILFGQEVNPETFAIAKSDMYLNDPEGKDADNIAFGTVLGEDKHAGRHFDYVIANPPYGKDWKRDEVAVKAEYDRGAAGRFAPGLPSISDGQMLFLEHMISHMQKPKDGGSRMAIIMNGSPLFTGDAGSGPSEIRRWILENDLLEAIVALPEQLFYNTGIATYVWVVTNRKAPERRGKVLLIDATSFWTSMRRNLGDKRREMPADKAAEILRLLAASQEGEHCRVYQRTHFGYRKVTVERPLKLIFQASPERIARLDSESAFKNLAVSKKKGTASKTDEEAEGRKTQDAIKALLSTLPGTLFTNRDKFIDALKVAEKATGTTLDAQLRKAVLSALSERDESADVCTDSKGNVEADPELRDSENVPLSEGIDDYFAREVTPYVADAWINTTVTDPKDGEIGKVGYEINFNRYFYTYDAPRPLDEIEADLKAVEDEIVDLLKQVTE
ncbi:MAG: class I SAM-dependent DNA methyltransferase [Coriobacteriia bacterium]|nr:class I SAM-dependent DNA methyltransferase [Coriobacteriia bacterium]